MDRAITQWINSFAGIIPSLDSLMILITKFGVPVIVAAVVLQWWSGRERLHVRHTAVSAGLSFLLGLALNQVILLFVHRMRPYDAGLTQLLIEHSSDWSFPSDHATASIAVAMSFLFQRLPKRGLALLGAAVVVCLSRVYVGTHYVTDVLGGAATGIIAAVVVRYAYRENSRLDRFATRLL